MDSAQNLYTILGVPASATPEDIRNAYRSAARRFHPDTNQHPGAAAQFAEIAAAYEILNNPAAREAYDLKRRDVEDRPYFSLRVTPSKRVLARLDEAQVLYVLAEIIPERGKTQGKTETNLNLTLVIDHSTSMNGVRLERTRAAAYQIIDQLAPNDLLSIVAFHDRAEVLIPSGPVTDKAATKAMIATMQAAGATEMFQGLQAGFKENQKKASRKYLNHIILITDGRTYGDEEKCLDLAESAAKAGIGISAMGIGDEWNDKFLDELVSKTGGNSEYINSVNAVVRFMNERVRGLVRTLAERVTISIAPDADITLESAFRIAPSAQPVGIDIDPIQVGQLQVGRNTSILFQLQVPDGQEIGFRSLLRICARGDVLREQKDYLVVADMTIEFSDDPPAEEPPLPILDALGKLTLYRMQEKAEEALQRGDIREATRRLETLATRLLSAGQDALANAAMAEAKRVATTNMLSGEGHKALKYGTRLLIAPSGSETDEQRVGNPA